MDAARRTAGLALPWEECQVPLDSGGRRPRMTAGWHSSPHSARCWVTNERGGQRMKLKPLGDRLIVRAIEEEETTASGIVLPDTAKEKPQKGKVLAVGEGKLDDDGKRIPLDVSEGDEVLYSK